MPRLHVRGRIADQVRRGGAVESGISPHVIEEVLYAQPEMGNNYQVYSGGERLRIEAELRPGTGDPDALRTRILDQLRTRGLQADLAWVEHVPRLGGKTRRVRPLAERDGLMAAASLLRR